MKTIAAIALMTAGALVAMPAAAQDDSPGEHVAEATRYALPHLLDGIYSSCGETLAADGYLMSHRAALELKFSDGANDSWPGAKQLLLDMANKRADDDVDIGALPDEALQPFVDAVITQLIVGKVKSEQCPLIERGLELLDPLPVENLSGLVEFIVDLAGTEARGKFEDVSSEVLEPDEE